MSETAKTVVFVLVAAILVPIAFYKQPRTSSNLDFLDDTGPFNPELTDPSVPTALEVIAFDDALKQGKPFRVQFKDGKWTIPSHDNYPADAADRLYKTAGSIIGLRKDVFVTSDKSKHADFGVVDPFEKGAASTGWGTRVKLFNKDEQPVADLIFGKNVEGKTGFKYVRVPGSDRVYESKADDVDLSIRFADWIDTNLLEVSSFDLDELKIHDIQIVEEGDRLVPKDSGTIEIVKDKDAKWQLAGLSAIEATNEDKIRDLANAISDLKIVGVRKKPAGLAPNLRTRQGQELADDMSRRGFYAARDGQLYSEQGEVLAESKDGLVYTLRFGGAFTASGDDLTAGREGEKVENEKEPAKDAKKEEDAPAAEKFQTNRFLLVSVEFDEGKFPPIPDPEPTKPAEKPAETKPASEAVDAKGKDAAAETKDANKDAPDANKEGAEAKKDAPKADAETKKDNGADAAKKDEPDAEAKKKAEAAAEAKKKADEEETKRKEDEVKQKREERDRKIKDGKEKAKKLSDRYAEWFYVISDDSFKKIRLSRADLVKPKEPPKDQVGPVAPTDLTAPATTDEPKDEPSRKDAPEKAETAKPAAKEQAKPAAKEETNAAVKAEAKPAAKEAEKPAPKEEPNAASKESEKAAPPKS